MLELPSLYYYAAMLVLVIHFLFMQKYDLYYVVYNYSAPDQVPSTSVIQIELNNGRDFDPLELKSSIHLIEKFKKYNERDVAILITSWTRYDYGWKWVPIWKR